eukprot:4542064-Pleurochrysis_carterae.AAC.1
MDGESWPLNLLDVFKKCERMTVFPIPHGMQSRPGAVADSVAHEAVVQVEEASKRSVVVSASSSSFPASWSSSSSLSLPSCVWRESLSNSSVHSLRALRASSC